MTKSEYILGTPLNYYEFGCILFGIKKIDIQKKILEKNSYIGFIN